MLRKRTTIAALAASLLAPLAVATSPAAAAPPPAISEFYFEGDDGYSFTQGGEGVLYLDEMAENFTLRAETVATESLEWYVNDDLSQKENAEPYYLNGDEAGDWNPVDWQPGIYEITAIPYSEDDQEGTAGAPKTLLVKIVAGTNPAYDIVVNTTADEHDANPGDGLCEAWVNEQLRCTLRAAVEEVNATEWPEATVGVPARGETYRLELGAIEPTHPIEIVGYAGTPTIDAQKRSRVFSIAAPSGVTQLRNLHLLNGRTPEEGGNVFVNGSKVHMHDVRLEGGNANNGGGVAIGEAGVVEIHHSVITGNSAGDPENFTGGGITQRGGGLFVASDSYLGVWHSTVSDNHAVRGGGISVERATFDMRNSVVVDNSSAARGGGIAFSRSAIATIQFSTIADNRAGTRGSRIDEISEGGGLFSYASAITLDATVLSGNTSYSQDKNERINDDCWTRDRSPYLSGRGNVISSLGPTCYVIDDVTGTQVDVRYGVPDRPLEIYSGRDISADDHGYQGEVTFFVEFKSPVVDFGEKSDARCSGRDVTGRYRNTVDDRCDSGAFTHN